MTQLNALPVFNDLTPLEICANCGESIGPGETPHIWAESAVVCSICRDKLRDQQMILLAFGKAAPTRRLPSLRPA